MTTDEIGVAEESPEEIFDAVLFTVKSYKRNRRKT